MHAHWADDGPLEMLDTCSAYSESKAQNSQAMLNHELLKAARDGNVEGVRKALARGGFVESRRPFVMTPENSMHGNKPGPKNVGKRDAGLSSVMYAAQGGYCRVMELLIDAGADVNAQDEDGLTPLHFAASSGCAEACRMLINAGADPDAIDDDGMTPFDHVPRYLLTSRSQRLAWEATLKPEGHSAGQAMSGMAGMSLAPGMRNHGGGA